MSAALAPPRTATEADRQAEGWRLARLAARFAVRSLEGEYDKPAGRAVIAAAIQKIDAIPVPDCVVVLPRAERLEAAIRTAIDLAGQVFDGKPLAEEAIAVLRDALR
ncbi:hypothetical protein [Neoroseomonas lacus]|uniref:Uncharacterized protein n=1 Tax=Neoroseomonas lacus TaxID=287609 RepID=A0A917KHJ5_9PROT|nr:hypothetical protein [Neoroseomonas lacus]GGJ14049.1 hypothetical protein GCM10011320_21660 [Neoroseomonas lacus]